MKGVLQTSECRYIVNDADDDAGQRTSSLNESRYLLL